MHKVGRQTLTAILLESESGRNARKDAKDRTSCTRLNLVPVCGSILCWIYFDVWIFPATESEFEQASMWSMWWSKEVDWPEWSWDPPAARVATQTQAQIWAMVVAKALFKLCLLYTGVYQKQLETLYDHFRRKSLNLLDLGPLIWWCTHIYHIFCLLKNLDVAQKSVQCPQQWLQFQNESPTFRVSVL